MRGEEKLEPNDDHVEQFFAKEKTDEEREQLVRDHFRELALQGKSKLDERKNSIKEIVDKSIVDKIEESSEYPLLFHDFDLEDLGGASYDLKVGEEVYVTTERKEVPFRLDKEGEDTLVIKPGEFGFLTTYEYIYIPRDLVGLISLRFKYKRRGLVNISGFHVDPGYCGKIIFAVYNTGPSDIVLRYKEAIFMIMLEQMRSGPTTKPYKKPGYERIPGEVISALRGPPVSLKNLDERIKKLETRLEFIIFLLTAIFAVIFSYIFFIK